MILIFGDRRDLHVETVRSRLCARGRAVSVFSRYDAEARFALELVDGDATLSFRCDGHTFRGGEVSAVWWRQKPFRLLQPDRAESTAIQRFIGREWHAALDPLEELMPQARWLNHPRLQQRANSKALQLLWAHQAGFKTPRTAFTNDASKAATMRDESPSGLIYKTLTSLITSDGQAVFTTDVTGIDLRDSDIQIGRAPGIYQELIPKRWELRVTFVGDDVFAFRIRSQDTEATSLDWRQDQEADIFEKEDPTPELSAKVQEFRRRARIDFGAIDIVVDDHGEMQFLECNPAGQWLWMEERTGVPVSDAVVDWLARPRR